MAEYEEKPKGSDEKVLRWQKEIDLALEKEKQWRKDCEDVFKIYRSEAGRTTKGDHRDTFNILWANTEIKRQALYNTLPRADIRRRYADKDPLGKAVAEILERGVSYTLDCNNTHEDFIYAVNDMLLPGRGGVRVKYRGGDKEECVTEHYQWDDYLQGPGKQFDEVPWVGWKHELTRDEAKKRFPKFYKKLAYETVKEDKNKNQEESLFKKTTVYEIWDKDERQVLWIGKDYPEAFLEIIDDPLEIDGFWPIPRPLYAIEDPTSMLPIVEFNQYKTLAKELENVTRRLLKLEDAVRVRGIYDSRVSELSKVFDSDDNELIPAENAAAMDDAGLDKAIWFIPIDTLVAAIQILEQQRDRLSQKIYEITGISDIVRGDTNPNETLGAQQMKANFASARMERQKQAVENFCRDVIRLIVDVISTFSRETLSKMTGLNYPTRMEQEQAKLKIEFLTPRVQQLQQMQDPRAQQLQQQIQQAQSVLGQVTWEDIEEVLQSDLQREYRVDVETDSTITSDKQREQESITHYLNAMGQFMRFSVDGINSGILPPEGARKVMAQVSRKFDLSRDIEDIFEMPIPPKQDPELEKAKMEAQQKEREHQLAMQEKQAEMQNKQQEAKMDMMEKAIELRASQTEAKIDQGIELLKAKLEERKAEMEEQRLENQLEFDKEKHKMEMQKLRFNAQNKAVEKKV